MNEMTLQFKQEINAHLGELEGATSQLADEASGPAQREAAVHAARKALATVEAFLQTQKSED